MVAELSDYKIVITQQRCIKDPVLSGGQVRLLPSGDPWRDTGGYCVVFKYETSKKSYAIRCWYQELDGIKERTSQIAYTIKQSGLPYFVEFEYVENGIFTINAGIQPIIRMEWVDACNLKEYIYKNRSYTSKLFRLANDFHKMCCDLHKANISHGDLQHANIKVRENGNLVLLDYDSLYHPNMGNLFDYIHGKTDYQHPLRSKNLYATKYIDAFSELVIFTSIIYYANNPNEYNEEVSKSDFMLFESTDYKKITDSPGYAKLICWSPQTEFLANVLVDNLKKNNLNDIDNIEKVVNYATTKGINLFIQNKYSEKELYEIAIKEYNNSNTTKKAISRFKYLADKNFPDAVTKLAHLSVDNDTIKRNLINQIVEDTRRLQEEQERLQREREEQERLRRQREEQERLERERKKREEEAERRRYFEYLERERLKKRNRTILNCALIIAAVFIAIKLIGSWKNNGNYNQLIDKTEQLLNNHQYTEAISILQDARNKAPKKRINDIDNKIADIKSEQQNIISSLKKDINQVWDTYFVYSGNRYVLNKNVIKYVSKNDIKPIVDSISEKVELLKNISNDQQEYKDNMIKINVLKNYYKLQ